MREDDLIPWTEEIPPLIDPGEDDAVILPEKTLRQRSRKR